MIRKWAVIGLLVAAFGLAGVGSALAIGVDEQGTSNNGGQSGESQNGQSGTQGGQAGDTGQSGGLGSN